MTSNHHALYVLGDTRATMAGTKSCHTVRWSESHKAGLSSDCSLQLDYMKLELLVIANQPCRELRTLGNASHHLAPGRSPYVIFCHSAFVCASTTYASCQNLTHGSLATGQQSNPYFIHFLRKEVIQPHLPIRLPCYDFTPVITPAFGSSFLNG